MRFKNIGVNNLYESMIRSGYPMSTGEPIDFDNLVRDLKWWFEKGRLIEIYEYLKELESNKNVTEKFKQDNQCVICGEYSPQRHLFDEYNIDYDFFEVGLKNSKETMTLKEALNTYSRIKRLSSCKPLSGHNNYEKGINVSFDMEFSHSILPQIQRYHFFEIISSQSKMHRIIKGDFSFTNRVLLDPKDTLNNLIYAYNIFDRLVEEKSTAIIVDRNDVYIRIEATDGCLLENLSHNDEPLPYELQLTKKELFETIVDNCPLGLQMWMGVTTNYLQLKTMYHQRKNHKMSEWQDFIKFCEDLPLFKELILKE